MTRITYHINSRAAEESLAKSLILWETSNGKSIDRGVNVADKRSVAEV
jgi:hypothetical protein